MYKYAQDASADGAVSAVPPGRPTARTSFGLGGGGSPRPIIIAAAVIAGVIILVLLLVFLVGSCSGGPGAPVEGASPTPQASAGPEPTPTRTPKATPSPTAESSAAVATAGPDTVPQATQGAAVASVIVLYEVQLDEKLLVIAESFGVTRKRIIRANEGMEDKRPLVAPGDIIRVPVSADMTIEEIEAMPGFQGLAE
jgi:hypothetical protein